MMLTTQQEKFVFIVSDKVSTTFREFKTPTKYPWRNKNKVKKQLSFSFTVDGKNDDDNDVTNNVSC